MKYFNLLFVSFSLFLFACQKVNNQEPITDVQLADLGNYKMKVLPDNIVSSSDVKLVIYDDCGYNILSGVTITGNTIDIEKHFNSMMKIACVLRNDTINIGKLPIGSYTVNYKLVDLAPYVKDHTSLAISFKLVVSK